MGEGLGSLGPEVHERLSATPALARDVSSPLRSSWKWGSSSGGHSNSSSPPTALNQLESSLIMSSVPLGSWGIWLPCPPQDLIAGYHQRMRGPHLGEGDMSLVG